MRAVDIIIKKRERDELTREEIDFFVRDFTAGAIPDYQVSSWAMAVLLNGMTDRETKDLTMAMAHSGDVLDFSHLVDIVVDKHSTGGVGDKTSLFVLPTVAACGLPVGKMSGRGLGFTGGTLDKLESIPGYRVNLSMQEFEKQLKEIGIVLTGQSAELAPADAKLYALRDVTGTVPSIPLIASSIMCKKIAGGAHAMVLDVKTGTGAFMQTLEDARKLAQAMSAIGKLAGREVRTVISDMNQPLGEAVGNVLEVREALDALRGGGPADFREHGLHMSAEMLVLGKKAADFAEGRSMAEKAIADGSAFDKFRQLVRAQGGDVSYVDDPDKMAKASMVEVVPATKSGWIQQVHAGEVGEAAVSLGAGRAKKGDPVDHAVGFIIHRKVGDRIEAGQPLFTIHANNAAVKPEVQARVAAAHVISDEPVPPLPLFYE
ncbi:MAG: thymidine phosphorylase [Chloroflexi bacterium]|nr:thymidine phosphorylase [Chloroflexota bacterium]